MSSGVGSLVLLQVFSRLLTFALNTVLARGLGPQWYALANVQLQLLTSTALFLSREGVRRAAQRVYPGGSGTPFTYAINLVWLSVPITLLTAVCLGISARHGDGTEDLMSPRERAAAVWMVCAAAVVEACAEPGWLYAQTNLRIPTRVAAEGGALVFKVVVTYYLTMVQRSGVLGFGAAQLVYALVYAGMLYLLLVRSGAPSMWPRPVTAAVATSSTATTSEEVSHTRSDGRWLSSRSRTLGLQYCGQSVQKYVLTEGERLVLIALSPLAQQVTMSVISMMDSNDGGHG